MAISINYTTKRITLTSAYTVAQFYQSLMDTFDELDQMDDTIPIHCSTPTVFELINGWEMSADSDFQYLSGGSLLVTKVGGNDLWSCIYTIGNIEADCPLYVVQNGTKLTSYWTAGHINILVKVMDAGTLIDAGTLTVYGRKYGDLYGHSEVDASAGGINPVPIQTAEDVNNTTADTTVATYGVTFSFGAVSHDLGNGNGSRPYEGTIDCNSLSLGEVYEFLKYATRGGSSTTIDGVTGEQFISLDAAYAAKPESPIGTFGGGKLFCARGWWLTNYAAADAKNFVLIDSNGVTQAPPNVVPIAIQNLVSGDRVFVTERSGTAIVTNKYTLAGVHAIGSATITVNETIGSDRPSTGTIRIGGQRYPYSSYVGSVFTLDGVTTTAAYANNDPLFSCIIDKVATTTEASNTLTFSSAVPVKVRVRNYTAGILPFEVDTTIGDTGLSVTVIRTQGVI